LRSTTASAWKHTAVGLLLNLILKSNRKQNKKDDLEIKKSIKRLFHVREENANINTSICFQRVMLDHIANRFSDNNSALSRDCFLANMLKQYFVKPL